ncbi:Ribosomal protein L25/L23 [Kalmanozyma brasiliensis GHG001]|uniref:Large ribosomal subunit protein uL23m n=1 Tax=Kalmanozyma brasiliensis (strain GHG001) TaxID=1365824 RepID=V5ENR9_KALBG|nr:Ribosomal protein L25/L23 [Kalmanozyma brasiliensis GHG001]EST04563.1 Ribosomal protein L25/L23 [Kalmanozyma brasiliensis GHG001]
MISASSSQSLLARTALRGAAASSRVAAVRLAARPASIAIADKASHHPSRSFSASPLSRQATEVEIPTKAVEAEVETPAADIDNDIDDLPPSEEAGFEQSLSELPTSGRKRRGKVSTDADKAKLLLKWGWFEERGSHKAKALIRSFRNGNFPDWLRPKYEEVKGFRSARARLWSPTVDDLRAVAGPDAEINDAEAWIEAEMEAHRAKLSTSRQNRKGGLSEADLWDRMDYERQVDFALRPLWEKMAEEQRSAALLRSRFDSVRKLGWRQGYSSGYPRPEGESSHLPAKLGVAGDEGWAAFRELQKAEEKEAWAAWLQLSPQEREAEEKAAWKLRDRSQIYIDDSEDSFILRHPAPRWYPVPERAGELTFLPNTIIKLVKNHTPEGTEYDAFKATFRVPLSMHKHALRSYLLSIYGLKTTWARSSIYRSTVTRDNRTGKVITGQGRTYKKVEVGLLEPFLFPEISPEFQKQHLLTSELDYERSRVYLKMTKTTRWRGKKSTEQYEQEIANKDRAMYHGLDALSSEGIAGDAKVNGEKFPRFMVKTKGLPSAKHGKILELLSKERREKEERVEALVKQYKSEAAAAAAAQQAEQAKQQQKTA